MIVVFTDIGLANTMIVEVLMSLIIEPVVLTIRWLLVLIPLGQLDPQIRIPLLSSNPLQLSNHVI